MSSPIDREATRLLDELNAAADAMPEWLVRLMKDDATKALFSSKEQRLELGPRFARMVAYRNWVDSLAAPETLWQDLCSVLESACIAPTDDKLKLADAIWFAIDHQRKSMTASPEQQLAAQQHQRDCRALGLELEEILDDEPDWLVALLEQTAAVRADALAEAVEHIDYLVRCEVSRALDRWFADRIRRDRFHWSEVEKTLDAIGRELSQLWRVLP